MKSTNGNHKKMVNATTLKKKGIDKKEKQKKKTKEQINKQRQKEVSEAKSNVEEIFSKIHSKGKNKSTDEGKKASSVKDTEKKKKKKNKKKMDTFKNEAKSRKYTPDGLPIYTMEELNIGKGGNTDLCPFDCNCCF